MSLYEFGEELDGISSNVTTLVFQAACSKYSTALSSVPKIDFETDGNIRFWSFMNSTEV